MQIATSNTQSVRDWRKALLLIESTLEQAIRNLDESALQIVLVVRQDGGLIGTVTDGDIRRGLLRGMDMQSVIEPIVHRTPVVAPPALPRDTVLQLMQANSIRQLPIVDEERRVIGLYFWDELLAPRERSNLVVIMAGGKGTRLLPHTEKCPKPLLPVSGRPMLEHIIEHARTDGFHHFVLAIGYLGHLIEAHCGDGSRWQVQIGYLREESPLGTAGAIALLDPPPNEPFLVTNGDVLTDIHYDDLLDFHVRNNAVATMAVRLHEWQHPFGVVRTIGVDITGFEEKPIVRSHVNAGIYVLSPVALTFLAVGDHCDMPTLFNRLREHGVRTIVYPMHEPWMDIGRLEDYAKANGV